MEFFARSGNPAGQRTDCAIAGVYSSGDLPAATQAVNKATNGLLDQLRKQGDLPLKPARCIWLPGIGDSVFRGLLLVVYAISILFSAGAILLHYVHVFPLEVAVAGSTVLMIVMILTKLGYVLSLSSCRTTP